MTKTASYAVRITDRNGNVSIKKIGTATRSSAWSSYNAECPAHGGAVLLVELLEGGACVNQTEYKFHRTGDEYRVRTGR